MSGLSAAGERSTREKAARTRATPAEHMGIALGEFCGPSTPLNWLCVQLVE